jgi:AcrR family transcriptional regulator
MSSSSLNTQQRLIQAALDLFLSQGIQSTTTRQIANLAEVNEVTLFRNFGNKYGLLQAVIETPSLFHGMEETLVQSLNLQGSLPDMLRNYAEVCLQALVQKPDFIRSLIGESDQYSEDLRQALGRKVAELHQSLAQILGQSLGGDHPALSSEKLLYCMNGMLLAYGIASFTSHPPSIWPDQHRFLEDLVQLCLSSLGAPERSATPNPPALSPHLALSKPLQRISDLPAHLVHEMMQRSRKASLQDYALCYLLFGAGLTPSELVRLERPHHISDPQQQVLQITTLMGLRQVPVNQWILGKRYGSYTHNPLTKWIRSRKDKEPSLFLRESHAAISEAEIEQCWLNWTSELSTPEGKPPAIAQAQQTWRIEMLMRGMTLENLSILTGVDGSQLQPYLHRAKEKMALEQAMQLDQKVKGYPAS